MGEIHGMKQITITELAQVYGRKPDTIQRKARALLPPPSGGKWSIYSVVTEDEARIILGDVPAPRPALSTDAASLQRDFDAVAGDFERATKRVIRTAKPYNNNQPEPVPAPVEDAVPARQNRTWVLYFLLMAPTAASVHNMFTVTQALSGNLYDAVALTVVLSASALGFVWYGVRSRLTIALAALLIAYESFCNLTRIYGGLMGSGTHTGNPTRFVGLVTDIFGTGTHQTAIFLGAFTAFFIAAVQYAAVFELNRK